jgi:large conductance mechanosensitive channel
MPEIPINTAKAFNFAKEFRDFLLKTNMLALALGVVLGGAASKVVNAIVEHVLGGIIAAFKGGSYGWDALNFSVWKFRFNLGPLINALIEFVCVAAVVFIVTKIFIKQAAPPPTKICPECLEPINPAANRCKFCMAVQPKPDAPPAG